MFKGPIGISPVAILIGLVLGGIVHISAILATPYFATDSAWQRLGVAVPVNSFAPLPPASPDAQALPFMAPDVQYAACRYDISEGDVAVRIAALATDASVAFYDRRGRNFHVIAGADTIEGRVDVLLLNKPATPDLITPDTADNADARSGRVVLRPASPQGLVVIRNPVLGAAWEEGAIDLIRAASCARVVAKPEG